MFRFAIRKGWVTADIYQKEWGLAAQHCWSQQVLPRATSRVSIAFAAELTLYSALVTASPHCTPLNAVRMRTAHSWSFLVKREQHWIQHSRLSSLFHNRTCILYPANWWHPLLTVRLWMLGLPLLWCHTTHPRYHIAAPPQDTSACLRHSFLGVLLILTTHINDCAIIATAWHGTLKRRQIHFLGSLG